jgi:hypothetical protein
MSVNIEPYYRDRDVAVFSKGPSFTVMVDTNLMTTGWQGGQGVQWTDAAFDDDTFIVTFSNGLPGGFLLWGSNESADQFISYTKNQPTYGFATYCFGPWVIATRTFEVYTLASRMAGPLVPIVYTAGEPLYFSLRGLFTNEDESGFGFVTGAVSQIPDAVLTNNYLTVQVQI